MGRHERDRGDDRSTYRNDRQRSDRGERRPDRPREDNQRYVNNNNYLNRDQEHDERVLAVIDRRTGHNNYAGAVNGGPRANLEVPIHERILGRRNSRKSIRERNSERPREDYPPL